MAAAGVPSHSLGPEASGPSNSSKSTSLIHEALKIPLAANSEKKRNSGFSLASALEPAEFLSRIKLVDIVPEEGTPSDDYIKGVEDLFGSLVRHGAAVIELNAEDSALVRCCLESAKLYFRTRLQSDSSSNMMANTSSPNFAGFVATGSNESYHYRAGRNLVGEDVKNPPPCMPDVFRCLGRTSRIMLGAICRKLQLRSDAFSPLLDDFPLGISDSSASTLVATHFCHSGLRLESSLDNGECSSRIDEGFLALVACDFPGLQVRDSNGAWCLADVGLRRGDLLVLAGRALQRVTSGFCCAHPYRFSPSSSSSVPGSTRRICLTFHLMPRGDAILDGSALKESGYAISEDLSPVVVSKFLGNLGVLETGPGTRTQAKERKRDRSSERTLKDQQTLRSLLRDPLTGTILEDAYTAPDCGHTFGGETLKRVKETKICPTCGATVNVESMIPNLALRAAALVYHKIARRRKTKIGSRKRRNELREHGERLKTMKTLKTLKAKRKKRSKVKRNDSESVKEEVNKFHVNEKVIIKGNKRTPETIVGKEAIITSKCFNGWYLLKVVDNGEKVRLRARSMQAIHQCNESLDVKAEQQSSDCMDS